MSHGEGARESWDGNTWVYLRQKLEQKINCTTSVLHLFPLNIAEFLRLFSNLWASMRSLPCSFFLFCRLLWVFHILVSANFVNFFLKHLSCSAIWVLSVYSCRSVCLFNCAHMVETSAAKATICNTLFAIDTIYYSSRHTNKFVTWIYHLSVVFLFRVNA